MKELIKLEKLSERTGIAKQTFSNWITNGNKYQEGWKGKRLIKGKHYIKPRRRILRFYWEAMLQFLEEESEKPDNTPSGKKSQNRIKD